MNPIWLLVGLEIGDRVREPLRNAFNNIRRGFRQRQAYRDWVESLPTTKGGQS